MTDPHIANYAARIAGSAAADGFPWKLSPAEALYLAARYGGQRPT